MTSSENDRLAVLEAKVDRILTILDDPDFGIRPKVRGQDSKIKSLEHKFYGLLTGILSAITLVVIAFFK